MNQVGGEAGDHNQHKKDLVFSERPISFSHLLFIQTGGLQYTGMSPNVYPGSRLGIPSLFWMGNFWRVVHESLTRKVKLNSKGGLLGGRPMQTVSAIWWEDASPTFDSPWILVLCRCVQLTWLSTNRAHVLNERCLWAVQMQNRCP